MKVPRWLEDTGCQLLRHFMEPDSGTYCILEIDISLDELKARYEAKNAMVTLANDSTGNSDCLGFYVDLLP